MKTLPQALQTLLAHARLQAKSMPSETQPISEARGRVLAEEVFSSIDVPSYDNSQMDGYAGRAVEMNNAAAHLPVSQRIAAGHPGSALKHGTVARIFTGAPIPVGADAVVMQEEVEHDASLGIRLLKPVTPGQNIRAKACDLKKGEKLFDKGQRLDAADLALLASVGIGKVEVFAGLRVAVFSSGDELRQPGEPIGPGQIYDSNRPMVLHMVKNLGFHASDMGSIPDDLTKTREMLKRAAADHDVILTCGGVSVGEEDHIKAAITLEGSLDLWKISVKPGKPFAFGSVGKSTLLGMPGNPVAAWVTFSLLVRPYLLARSGVAVIDCPSFAVVCGFDWPKPDARQEFLRGHIDAQGRAQIHGRQNSAVLSSVTQSQGLIEIPALTPVRQGDIVRFIPYTSFH